LLNGLACGHHESTVTTQTYAWGRMDWLASAEVGNASGLSLARMYVKPEGVSERHRHANCEEIVMVQAGVLEMERDGTVAEHHAGEVIVIPVGCAHQVRNAGSEELVLLLTYGAGRRAYEAC